jgi:hypothetical protein
VTAFGVAAVAVAFNAPWIAAGVSLVAAGNLVTAFFVKKATDDPRKGETEAKKEPSKQSQSGPPATTPTARAT